MCHKVCCDCKKYLGKNSCECEQVTHGYCEKCLKKAIKEVEEFTEGLKKISDSGCQ